MRQIIIPGNWKLNGTIEETEFLLKGLLDGDSANDKVRVVVCPPFTAIYRAAQIVSGSHIFVGGQDMSVQEKGAYTAEISASMLLTAGARYVILGHSERRQYHSENDQQVNLKAKVALAAGLTPIICVGETLEEREADRTEAIVCSQVDGTLSEFSAEMLKKSVIAYEPVWAIGTGKTATPEMAQDVHRLIREQIAQIDKDTAELVPILYGGSMKAANAAELIGQPDVDGGLIGGASLKAEDFIGIIKSV